MAWLDLNINGAVDPGEPSGQTSVAWTGPKCGDAAVVGVRGSGDNSNGDAYPGRHAAAVAQRLVNKWGLKLYDNDGGNDNVIGLAYPAASVPFALAGYKVSVDSGVSNLLTELNTIRTTCGDSFPILLVGFSQGSHVIQTVLEKLDDSGSNGSVAGAALLASPRFSPNDAVSCGSFLADYPSDGVAGAALVRGRFADSTRSWCLANDQICVSRLRNFSLVNRTHQNGYNDGTFSGNPILDDAAGLLAWDVLSRRGGSAHPDIEGGLNGYRTASISLNNDVRVSAVALFARGAPSKTFRWDFNGDGVVDQTSTTAWVTHRYGVRVFSGPSTMTTKVSIEFADGTQVNTQICIRRAASGSTTC